MCGDMGPCTGVDHIGQGRKGGNIELRLDEVASLMVGVSVNDTTIGTTVGNLGFSEVRFPKPVFAGDTLRSRTKVLAMRESKSRPDVGIL